MDKKFKIWARVSQGESERGPEWARESLAQAHNNEWEIGSQTELLLQACINCRAALENVRMYNNYFKNWGIFSQHVKLRYFLSRKCRLRTVSRKKLRSKMTPQFNIPPPLHTLKAKTDLLRAYDKKMRFPFWFFLKAEVTIPAFSYKTEPRENICFFVVFALGHQYLLTWLLTKS